MSGINNNNLFLHLNSKRWVQAEPTKQAVENALGENENKEAAPAINYEDDTNLIPFMDINQRMLIDMKNIKIISSVKPNVDKKFDTETSGQADDSHSIDGTQIIDDININTSNSASYTLDTLKNTYHLTDKDISNFFDKQGDKYVIKKSAVKSCFGKENINTVQQLFDAIKNIGYSEGYVRGAYGFSAENTAKYLVLSSENPKRYTLNQDAIKAYFPNSDIKTLGQLQEYIDNVRSAGIDINPTDNEENLTSYSKEELINNYKFSDKDISILFTKKDDKYIINTSFVKENFPNKDIKTVEELLDCVINAKYSQGQIKGLFGFDDNIVEEFFTVTNDGKYVLNQEALKNAFPEEDIRTPGQLVQAISDYGYVSLLSEEKKSQLLEDIKTGFLNGDKNWGFINLEPSEEQVEDLYQKLLADEDIINFTGTASEFKTLLKTKSAELIKDIKDQITAFTENDLKGRFGFSSLEIQLFFTQDEHGHYKMDMTKINEFWGEGYKRDNIDKLLDFVNSYGLGENRRNQICELIAEAFRNGDKSWGFDGFDPAPTEKEIQSLYWQLVHLDDRGNQPLQSLENIIRTNLPRITNKLQLDRFEARIDGNEFNKTVSSNELNEYTNKYIELVKTDLKNKHYYSDEYLEEIFSYAIQELNINDGNPHNLKNVLTSLRNNIKELSQESPHLSFTESYHQEISRLWSKNISYDSKMMRLYGDNIQTRFLGNLIYKYCNNLSNEEIKSLFNIIISRMGGEKDYSNTNYELQLDSISSMNGDGSWFDEFFYVLSSKTSKVKNIPQYDISSATSIDINALFGSSNTLTAEDIINNFDALMLSDDPGVRKLMQTIEDGFEKFQCIYKIDKKDLIEKIIYFINKEYNIANTNPPTLTKDAVEKLNQNNCFEKIKNIIDSQEFYLAYMVNVDGVIDDFGQGSTGDCWLLSAIKALASTPAGQQIIKNQIKWTDDYSSVTVYFAGIPKYVTISAEEIIEAIQSGGLSTGDNDVLVLELAMQKIYGDINSNHAETFWSRFVGSPDSMGHVNGNTNVFLTGLLAMKMSGKGFAATFSLHGHSSTVNCKDGSSFSYDEDKNHALAITDITDTTVTFINPWDSGKEYTVSWEEFAKLGAYRYDFVTF